MNDIGDTARQKLRVVRFLSAGAAHARPAAGRGTVLLDGGERGTISASLGALSALAREGLVAEAGGLLSLSQEGRALAMRDRHPQEPFRAQHLELGTRMVAMEGGEQVVPANLAESPLAQLARRRVRGGQPFLEEGEFRAGERLRADYTRGQIMPRLGANWSEAVASGQRGSSENGIADLTDAALAARRRVDDALTAVGPELAGVLIDVCCFLKGLEKVEMERAWPARSAKVVLKAALGALCRHYEPQPRARRRTILHWGAEGYRPSLR
ncbi:DUF6456 domain-containing protein [Chelativorans sp. AA-79]|uniref:DUF6456 domain-containing protein n=1 Tax=Chelativorans sp. AA-79 TaxID=3028735 RepID=UPI0023F7DE2F|nr:DUF6456 domain-containing protein [Chelativorans sp. AA-79]WEX07748.1 DUF6456 domain-containing protein [Chelativorans sp. AA-79]